MADTPEKHEIPSEECGINEDREDIGTIFSLPLRKAELLKVLNIERQYEQRLETLWHYGLLKECGQPKDGDAPVPSLEQVAGYFDTPMLETTKRFNKPVILLSPEMSFRSMIQALDSHKMHPHNANSVVNDTFWAQDTGSEIITGWRASIIDGFPGQVLYKGDDVNMRLAQRIANREREKSQHFYERGINRYQYLLLMMEALKIGNPIDCGRFTILDGDKARSKTDIPVAGFGDISGFVGFAIGKSTSKNKAMYFRGSIGGDELIAA